MIVYIYITILIWGLSPFLFFIFNYIQGEVYIARASVLKKKVRDIIGKVSEMWDKVEVIDTLQRLGLAHHFEDEIKTMLQTI